MAHTKNYNVTELDFQEIKANIKNYFRRQDSEFKDWDFEGSGLNTLIDVLAYNTHYNAVNAHVALNESFLDSAQVRSNVISRAKLLGYTPSSVTSPVASVTCRFIGTSNIDITNIVSLPRGTSFTGTADGVSYTFITLESYNASATNNVESGNLEFVFEDIKVYEGALLKRRFDVNENDVNQKFVIADSQFDTQHMKVSVYDNINSQNKTTYTRFENFDNIDSDATVYFIYENHEGYYQIEFGDNILGKKLESGNIVEVEYLQTAGVKANNVQRLSFTGSLPTGTSALANISTLSKSAGGADRESLESVKYKAPLSFISQNRAVSASDYNALISKHFNNLQSLSVWGGEYNDPPQYGRVFISAKPFDALTLTDAEKDQLLNLLSTKKILAIQPQIVDPDILYIYANVLFKYDSNLTSLSQGELEEEVINELQEYNDNTLEKFEGVFRYSRFLDRIDSYSNAVISSNANVFVYKNILLTLGNTQPLEIKFDTPLGNAIDQVKPILSSDAYLFNDVNIYIEDEVEDSTKRNVYTYRIVAGNKTRLTSSIGKLYPETGRITLNPVSVDTTQQIKLRSYPRSNDIVSKRNQILSLDTAASSIKGEIDTIAISGETGKTTYNTFNKSY